MSSIATGWYPITAPFWRSLLLAWSPIWLIIGIIITGPFSDAIGRKNTFTVTMTLYGIGAIGLYFSTTYSLVLIFLAILLFAAGGEMNTIMVATHEMMPRQHRGKAAMMELNFINLGGVILAVVSIAAAHAYAKDIGFQRAMIALTALVVLMVLIVARSRMPESVLWLIKRGRKDQAEAQVAKYYPYGLDTWLRFRAPARSVTRPPKQSASTALRYYISISAAFGNTAGFGLMTYVLAPRFFQSETATILLVADAVQLLAGFLGLFADRLSRKLMLFGSTALTFVVTVVVWSTEPTWSRDLTLFFVLLVFLNVFNAVAYLTEDTVKAEIWPTERRATNTAIVRFVSIGVYAVSIFVTQDFDLRGLVLFNAAVWFVAALGTLIWFLKGVETGAGVSVAEASQEN